MKAAWLGVALLLTACDRGEESPPAAPKQPAVPKKAASAPTPRELPPPKVRVARVGTQAAGFSAGAELIDGQRWSLAAKAEVALDLPVARVTLFGPGRGNYALLDAPLIAVGEGAVQLGRAPGQGARQRAWLATPALLLAVDQPVQLFAAVRSDGTTYVAVLSGAAELLSGRLRQAVEPLPRTDGRELAAGSAILVSPAGEVLPVPAPPARMQEVADRASAALQKAQVPTDRPRLDAQLDTLVARVVAENAQGDVLHAAQRKALASGGKAAARKSQPALVAHSQRLSRLRRALTARLGRYLASSTAPQPGREQRVARARAALAP